MEKYPGVFEFSVSYTTRDPRPGEVHGQHYFYVTRDDFEQGIIEGDFLEHVEYSGNFYGTSKKYIQTIQERGCICLLDIDIKGAEKLIGNGLDANVLMLVPPSFETLKERLLGRGTETPESLLKRLNTAKNELEAASTKTFITKRVVNDNLDKCEEDVIGVLKELYPSKEF